MLSTAALVLIGSLLCVTEAQTDGLKKGDTDTEQVALKKGETDGLKKGETDGLKKGETDGLKKGEGEVAVA